MAELSTREKLQRRVSAMTTERESFINHYQELSRYFNPRLGRFLSDQRNKGEKRHQSIINSHGTRALRKATAGMLAGVMSPARPWFSLQTPDPGRMKRQAVKEWLYDVEIMMRAIFNAGNLYNMAPVMIEELLLFGTGAMTQEDDFNDVARFFTHTAGSYMIAQDERYKVTTFVREFEWTVEQIVSAFGLANVSTAIKNRYDKGDYDAWFKVTQCVYPNEKPDARSPMATAKRWASVYYEPGSNEKEKLLRQSGFDEFPGYFPRWHLTGEDIYGTNCPGMTALGDAKQLQLAEKRKAQAIDKLVDPPLHGPAGIINRSVSTIPGGLTLYDMNGTENKLAPIYTVNPQLRDFKDDIAKTEGRVDDAFYVDLFLAISSMDGIQPRNEFELNQRNQERLLQLGPVLERLHNEFLNPLIDRTFTQMSKAGILPPPPPELEGQALKVEYISSLAQAQRAVATTGIDRVAAFVGGLVKAGLSDGRKFNSDQAIQEYSHVIGVPPRIIRDDDDVAAERDAAQKQMQAMQAMEMAQAGANTTKMLSDAKTTEPSALTRVVGRDEEDEA